MRDVRDRIGLGKAIAELKVAIAALAKVRDSLTLICLPTAREAIEAHLAGLHEELTSLEVVAKAWHR